MGKNVYSVSRANLDGTVTCVGDYFGEKNTIEEVGRRFGAGDFVIIHALKRGWFYINFKTYIVYFGRRDGMPNHRQLAGRHAAFKRYLLTGQRSALLNKIDRVASEGKAQWRYDCNMISKKNTLNN